MSGEEEIIEVTIDMGELKKMKVRWRATFQPRVEMGFGRCQS